MTKRVMSMVLVVALLFLGSINVAFIENQEAPRYLRAYFINQGYSRNLAFKFHKDEAFLNLKDVLAFTGFNATYTSDTRVFVLQRGQKTVTLNDDAGYIVYENATMPFTPLLREGDEVWVPMYPTLSFLNTHVEPLDDDTLLVVMGHESVGDFVSYADQLIQSERHFVYNHTESIAYYPTLILSSITDIVKKGKIGSAMIGEYHVKNVQEALLRTLDQDLQSLWQGGPVQDIVTDIAKLYQDTKWFKELDAIEQFELAELTQTLDAIKLASDYFDIYYYVEAVKQISELNVGLLRDGFKNRSMYALDSVTLKEVDKIIALYDKNDFSVVSNEVLMQVAAHVADAKADKMFVASTAASLTAKAVTGLYSAFGYDGDINAKFVLRNSYYVIQQEVEDHFYTLKATHKDINALDKAYIDSLYALPCLYVMVGRAADIDLFDGVEKVTHHADALSYLISYSKSQLLLDIPSLNQDYMPPDQLMRMKEAAPIQHEKQSMNNIQNNGFAVSDGEYIYFKNVRDGLKLYRMSLDGTHLVRLQENAYGDLNMVNGMLIASDYQAGGAVVRVYPSGFAKELLSDANAQYVFESGGWIYYQNGYQGNIHRMRLDGSEDTPLLPSVRMYHVEGDWMYYVNSNGLLTWHMPTGTEGYLIDIYVQHLAAEGDWVYLSISEIESFYRGFPIIRYSVIRVKSDGSGRELLAPINVRTLHVHDGWVYYSDLSDGLFKMRTDGSEVTHLSHEVVYNINIVGDWLLGIYSSLNDSEAAGGHIPLDRMLMLRLDGSERRELEKGLTTQQ